MGMITNSVIEYLTRGINWKRGCSHNCHYCYQHGAGERFSRLMPQSGDWASPEYRVADPVASLRKELAARTTLPQGPLMLCTSHDPAMDAQTAEESAGITRAMADFRMLERTLYLTKAPNRALVPIGSTGARDEATATEGLRFGTSFTSTDAGLAEAYEPGAERPAERLLGLRRAADLGYHIWVSVEPPLPGVYLRQLVEALLAQPFPTRPWIVLGKLNVQHRCGEDIKRWARSDHWALDRELTITLLQRSGYVESLRPMDGGYWIKKELRACR